MAIYFLVGSSPLLNEDVVKIGYSKGNTSRRLYDVGTGCPFPLDLYAVLKGDKKREKAIHDQFAAFRIHKEWFRWTDDIEEWIDDQEIAETGGLVPYNPGPEEVAQNAAAAIRHREWMSHFAKYVMGETTVPPPE